MGSVWKKNYSKEFYKDVENYYNFSKNQSNLFLYTYFLEFCLNFYGLFKAA